MTQKKTATQNQEPLEEQNQNPEVQNPIPEDQKQEELKAQEKPKEKNPETPKPENKNPVDPHKYERYTNLKFLKLEGGVLREDYEKELADLEKELKSCSGKKAAKTRTASIGMNVIKFVEGIPVPKSVLDLVPEKDRGFYFV